MCHVLKYLIQSSKPLIHEEDLENIQKMTSEEWQETVRDLKGKPSYFVDFRSINVNYLMNINLKMLYCAHCSGSIVTKPGMKPCSIRIDQLDRDVTSHPNSSFPDIIHFGIRPPQLSYAGSKK